MKLNIKSSTPRIKIIQKLYSKTINPDEKITYNKSQYRKFIKDVTEGTIERKEYIENYVTKNLKDDFDLKRTDLLLKMIIFAAVFELLFKHNNPKKVIISEYIKTSQFFLEKSQIKYLNAILDKLSHIIRKD
jgi:N utilization substance protein B|tara:strand:- start:227 stop:622 length:396 start_codon:yes stop_codon:yes gene_type:complete